MKFLIAFQYGEPIHGTESVVGDDGNASHLGAIKDRFERLGVVGDNSDRATRIVIDSND